MRGGTGNAGPGFSHEGSPAMYAPTPGPVLAQSALTAFYTQVYQPTKLLGARPATLESYRTTLAQLDRWWGHSFRVRDLSDENIGKFVRERRMTGASAATCNRQLGELRALWRLASQRLSGRLPPPTLGDFPEPKRLPVAWTPAEFARILAEAQQQAGVEALIDGVPAAMFWRALLLTVYDSGGRIGAVMLAAAAQLDVERSELLLVAESQKQQADQLVALSREDTLPALERMLRYRRHLTPRSRLFGWPYDAAEGTKWQTLRRRYRKILLAAGLPASSRDMFHKLRRTTLSAVAAKLGIDEASRVAGHSSIAVTREHYVDPRQLGAHRICDHLPRPNVEAPVIETQRTLF